MNLFTYALHVVGSGAMAYMSARNLRDRQTRPNLLAGLQLAESGSVPFLEALRDRAEAEGDRGLNHVVQLLNDNKRCFYSMVNPCLSSLQPASESIGCGKL